MKLRALVCKTVRESQCSDAWHLKHSDNTRRLTRVQRLVLFSPCTCWNLRSEDVLLNLGHYCTGWLADDWRWRVMWWCTDVRKVQWEVSVLVYFLHLFADHFMQPLIVSNNNLPCDCEIKTVDHVRPALCCCLDLLDCGGWPTPQRQLSDPWSWAGWREDDWSSWKHHTSWWWWASHPIVSFLPSCSYYGWHACQDQDNALDVTRVNSCLRGRHRMSAHGQRRSFCNKLCPGFDGLLCSAVGVEECSPCDLARVDCIEDPWGAWNLCEFSRADTSCL